MRCRNFVAADGTVDAKFISIEYHSTAPQLLLPHEIKQGWRKSERRNSPDFKQEAMVHCSFCPKSFKYSSFTRLIKERHRTEQNRAEQSRPPEIKCMMEQLWVYRDVLSWSNTSFFWLNPWGEPQNQLLRQEPYLVHTIWHAIVFLLWSGTLQQGGAVARVSNLIHSGPVWLQVYLLNKQELTVQSPDHPTPPTTSSIPIYFNLLFKS